MFRSRTFFIVMSSSSNLLSRFNRFSINLKTQDIIDLVVVVIVKIENISATRFYSLYNYDSRLWLLPNITNLCLFFFFGELNPWQSLHRSLPFPVFFGEERSMRLLNQILVQFLRFYLYIIWKFQYYYYILICIYKLLKCWPGYQELLTAS